MVRVLSFRFLCLLPPKMECTFISGCDYRFTFLILALSAKVEAALRYNNFTAYGKLIEAQFSNITGDISSCSYGSKSLGYLTIRTSTLRSGWKLFTFSRKVL